MRIQETRSNEPTRQEGHPRRHRRLPVGAEVCPAGGVHFRVWASCRQRVEVVLEGGVKETPGALPLAVALAPEAEAPGYFSALVTAAGAGTLYRYRLDGGPALYPDPASRFQPSGPPGPSQVIDPGTFQWTDSAWPGVPLEGQVIYEMHLGNLHTGRHVGGCQPRTTRAGGCRHDPARDHASGRLPGPLRLGL